MKNRAHPIFILTAALVIVISFLGGALAPPLHRAAATVQEVDAITLPQWGALSAAIDVLSDVDSEYTINLPFISRSR